MHQINLSPIEQDQTNEYISEVNRMLRVKSSLNIISLERKRAKSSKHVQKFKLTKTSQPAHIHVKSQEHT